MGGFFDFGEVAGAGAGGVEVVGEDVGIGGDDAEEIVQGVSDELSFGGRKNGGIGDVGRVLHLGSLSKTRLRFICGEARSDRGVKHIGGEGIERQAARGAGGEGLEIEIGNGRRVESEDGENGILGADFFDVVEALEIPGVDIESDGVIMVGGEGLEEVVEGI